MQGCSTAEVNGCRKSLGREIHWKSQVSCNLNEHVTEGEARIPVKEKVRYLLSCSIANVLKLKRYFYGRLEQ